MGTARNLDRAGCHGACCARVVLVDRIKLMPEVVEVDQIMQQLLELPPCDLPHTWEGTAVKIFYLLDLAKSEGFEGPLTKPSPFLSAALYARISAGLWSYPGYSWTTALSISASDSPRCHYYPSAEIRCPLQSRQAGKS